MKLPKRLTTKQAGLCTITLLTLFCSGCTTDGGYAPSNRNPETSIGGVGLSSNEFAKITSSLVNDLAALPALRKQTSAPRIYFDASLFQNDSPQVVDKSLLISRIRSGLMRATSNDIVFVQSAAEQFDYVLTGRFSAKTSVNPAIGLYERFNQISFDLYDISAGQNLIWSEIYESNKSTMEDSIYR